MDNRQDTEANIPRCKVHGMGDPSERQTLVEAGEVMKGEPWCYPPEPEPYVKPTRFRVEYDEKIGYYVLIADNIQYGTSLPYLSDKHAHKEVAERIAAIYEEEMP